MEDLSKLYIYDNGVDENADMRLKYLQAQADAQPTNSIENEIMDRVTMLCRDLYQFVSKLGTMPIESVPYSFYMVMNRGDNMFSCGVILILIGLLGVAFSSDAVDVTNTL